MTDMETRTVRLATALAPLLGDKAVQDIWWACEWGHVLPSFRFTATAAYGCTYRDESGSECAGVVQPVPRPKDLGNPAVGLAVLEEFLRQRGGSVLVDYRGEGWMALVRDGGREHLGQVWGHPTLWAAVLAAWEQALRLEIRHDSRTAAVGWEEESDE